MIEAKIMFSNYSERMKRLAILEPLYSLANKRTKDDSGRVMDMFEIGLITLLFFFENKLSRNKQTGIEELGTFLHNILDEKYDLKKSDYLLHARTIVEIYRPPSGKRHKKVFYDFESKKDIQITYSILKAGQSDLQENKQYYELDEDGLELVFATSEYFSEYQISISQMLIRKQLEKGEFISALRQIDEMSLSVYNLKDRMTKLKWEINRNVTSEDVYKNYKNLTDDINRRLEVENQEFDALRNFVVETIQGIKNNLKEEKDRKAYQNVLMVNSELEKVHLLHNDLLKESITIKKSALRAAKESLYYVGVESFNFNKEIISRIVSEPLKLESVREITKPFLFNEQARIWSPLAVFFPQRVFNKGENVESASYLDIDDTEVDEHFIEEIYRHMMKLCMMYISDKHTLTLSDLIEALKGSEYEEVMTSRYFYDFWMILYHYAPIDLTYDEKDKTHSILIAALHQLRNQYTSLCIRKEKDFVKVQSFTMSNMTIILEDNNEL